MIQGGARRMERAISTKRGTPTHNYDGHWDNDDGGNGGEGSDTTG